MELNIKTGHICESGLVRKENQDAYLAYVSNSISVFCVADGMGGHANGKRASTAIVNGIREWIDEFYAGKYESVFSALLDDFEKKLADVNQQIFRFYNRGQTCGSTLAVLIIFDRKYAVFSMGDSRVYRKRNGIFSRLTKDDTWENSDRAPSGIPVMELRHYGNYGKLTCALGIQESFVPHRLTDKLKSGDTFLLCSDGVYKYCDTKILAKACSRKIRKSNALMAEKLQLLRTNVMDGGASDNFTAILVTANNK